MARQVGAVAEINLSTSSMAAISFNVISFVPGLVFRFGSLSFTAGDNGKLHASDQETIRSDEIGSNLTNNLPLRLGSASVVDQEATQRDNAFLSGHDSLSSPGAEAIRSEKGKATLPRFSLGSRDSSSES